MHGNTSFIVTPSCKNELVENVGKKITDFFCNGFAGRRYDLTDSIIEAEGRDWIVIRTVDDEPVHLNLKGWNKQEHIDKWTDPNNIEP